MIYLDPAATTPVPAAVADAMYDVLRHQFGNPSAQYPYGRESAALVDRCRAAVAQGLGCRPEQLFFTSCGTESDNWAISAASLPPPSNTAPFLSRASGSRSRATRSPI